MEIIEFVKIINQQKPNIDLIRNKYKKLNLNISEENLIKLRSEMEIVYEANSYDLNKENIYELIESTNLHKVGIGLITFNEKIQKDFNSNFLEFATYNDSYKFALDISNHRILIYTDEEENIDVFAENLNIFLYFLTTYSRFYYFKCFSMSIDLIELKEDVQKLIKSGIPIHFIREYIEFPS